MNDAGPRVETAFDPANFVDISLPGMPAPSLPSTIFITPHDAAFLAGIRLMDHEGKIDEAIEKFRECIRINPMSVAPIVNLGVCYQRLGKTQEAIAIIESALSICPFLPLAYRNLAAIHWQLGNPGTACALIEKAADQEPDNPQYAWNRSFYRLATGDLANGWTKSEARFVNPDKGTSYLRVPSIPYWEGQIIADKKIRLWVEQGLGEQILFLPMVSQLVALGAKVSVECHSRMTNLFRRSLPDEVELISCDASVGVVMFNPADHDYQLPIGNLGAFFRRCWDDFPVHQGFLTPDPVLVGEIRARYEEMAGGRPIIGIAWRSDHPANGRPKSVPLMEWGPILAKDAFFVSVQYGDVNDDIGDAEAKNIHVDPEVAYEGDMDMAVAQIAALDALVSISTTSLHIAGALNIPTLAMINRPWGANWYWFLRRHDCPWYPSVRLFRAENVAGDWWAGPVLRIADEIAQSLLA